MDLLRCSWARSIAADSQTAVRTKEEHPLPLIWLPPSVADCCHRGVDPITRKCYESKDLCLYRRRRNCRSVSQPAQCPCHKGAHSRPARVGNADSCIFVSPNGDDGNPGQLWSPCGHSTRRNWQPMNSRSRDQASYLSTSAQARITSQKQSCSRRQTRVHRKHLSYTHLNPGEHVVLSGGSHIEPRWTPYRNGLRTASGSPTNPARIKTNTDS
jgi:hypothetical protein